MCTVTISPEPGNGFRLWCNRDERRTRPPALPPQIVRIGGRLALFPVDPVGGGTWIGVNDAGLAATLLNRTVAGEARPPWRPARSRGLIVPCLLGCASIDDALALASRVDPHDFEPFRLVVVQGASLGVVIGTGRALRLERSPLLAPRLFASSSLGDGRVEAPRARLFARLVGPARPGWAAGQRRLHHHRWPERPDISVVMARPDAATVSRTMARIGRGRVWMRYEPLEAGGTRLARVA